MRAICTIITFILFSGMVFSQNIPFPRNRNYTNGTIKPNHKTTSQLNTDITTFYNQWKQAYVKNNCTNSSHYYINYNGQDANVSEGTGYGMIVVAMMAGFDPNAKTIFDGLYYFYKAHPSQMNPRLMAWRQFSCVTEAGGGSNSATDGDVDIAFGLLAAHAQWGSNGAINYLQEAKFLIDAIMQDEINPTNFSVELGDWVNSLSGNYYNATRSSDIVLAHFKAYLAATGDTKWNNVYEKGQSIIATLQANNSPNTGLLPDFIINVNTTPIPSPPGFLESGNDGNYYYNACRDPWRIGSDYLFSGDVRSKTAVNKINIWLKNKYPNPATIQTGFSLSGALTGGDYQDMSFIAPFMVGVMVDNAHQTYLNSIYDYVVQYPITSADYYGNTIKMICLLIATGNYESLLGPTITCPKPNLGTDKSLCGVSSTTLTSGVVSTGKTFTWYRNGSVISGSNASLSVSQAGTYVVKVDSTSSCALTDTVLVSATLPTPSIGTNISLCQQSSATITSSVAAANYTYVWKKDGQVLSNQSKSTLVVTDRGDYHVSISAIGCSTVNSNTITVTSSLLNIPSKKICAPGESATLNVVGGSSNPVYMWFDAATNGNLLHTGVSYTSVYQSSKTVYVQEGSGVSGSIGGTGLINGNAPWSPSPQTFYTSMKFSTLKPYLTIKSVDFYIPAGAKASAFVVSVMTSSGSIIASSTPFTYSNVNGTAPYKVTVQLDAFIPDASTGYQLAFTASTNDNYNAVYQGLSVVYPINETSDSVQLTGGSFVFNNIVFSSGSNCIRTPATVTLDPNSCMVTSIASEDRLHEVTVFPNPTNSDMVQLSSNVDQVEVYNMLGEQLFSEQNTISVRVSEKGMYILKITNGGNLYSVKIIRE